MHLRAVHVRNDGQHSDIVQPPRGVLSTQMCLFGSDVWLSTAQHLKAVICMRLHLQHLQPFMNLIVPN